MDELIKKKIEYLLRLLKYEQYEETNNIDKNNNLSTLVETAIEVIKDNKHTHLKKKLDEIQNTVSELQKRDEPLTDNQYSILLDEDMKILNNIVPNEEIKEEYDEIMTKLNALSKVTSLKNSNVSKIVQTALDVIIHNKHNITNKEINETTKDQYEKIRKRLKQLKQKISNLKRQAILEITTYNNKQIIGTAIDILTQSTQLYQRRFETAPIRGAIVQTVTGNLVEVSSAERIEIFNGVNNSNGIPLVKTAVGLLSHSNEATVNGNNISPLVNTAVDLLSKSTNVTSQPPPPIRTVTNENINDIHFMEKQLYINMDNEVSSILKNIKTNYDLLTNFINEPNDEEINDKNIKIQKLRNEFDNLIIENSKKLELLEKDINDIINKNSLLKSNKSISIIEAENQITIIDDKTKVNNVIINNNSKEIEKFINDIKNRENQIQVGQQRMETIQKSISDIGSSDETRLKTLQNSLQQKQDTNKKLENDLIELNNDKELLENNNNNLIGENDTLKEEKKSLNDNIRQLEGRYIEEKTKLLEENKTLIEKINSINDLNEIYRINMGKIINNNLEELENLKKLNTKIDAVDTNDIKLLNVTNDLLNMIPKSAINPEDLYNLLPNIGNFNDILSKIKENVECPTTQNLIGKIDNECLYFNDENKIDVTTEDYDKIKAIMDENNKWKENVKNVLIK